MSLSFLTPKGMQSTKHEDGFDENVPYFSSNRLLQRGLENQENIDFEKKYEYDTSQFRVPIIKQENESDAAAWKADGKNLSRGLHLDLDLINDSYFEFKK